MTYAGRSGIHPLESVDRLNPRPGLRRWVAVNTATGERSAWKESWASIHNDGSVTLATAIGGHRRSGDAYYEGWQLQSSAIECAIADVMGLIRAAAEAIGNDEYDVRVGINWAGEQPLTILTMDNQGFIYDGVSIPLHRYTPVETTLNATEPALDYYWHVHDLAQDCVNQGGISNALMTAPLLEKTRRRRWSCPQLQRGGNPLYRRASGFVVRARVHQKANSCCLLSSRLARMVHPDS